MATITLSVGEMLGGAIRAEMDVNDANWKPSKARVINDSDQGYQIIVKELGQVVWTATVASGESNEWNITAIQLGWQEDYWNSDTQQYEAAGLDLGDYEIGGVLI
jgi:hypothetical protein